MVGSYLLQIYTEPCPAGNSLCEELKYRKAYHSPQTAYVFHKWFNLHCLERKMRPILTPHSSLCKWPSCAATSLQHIPNMNIEIKWKKCRWSLYSIWLMMLLRAIVVNRLFQQLKPRGQNIPWKTWLKEFPAIHCFLFWTRICTQKFTN